MGNVKLTVNREEIEIPAGKTILETAKSAGVYIPTLCYHPDLPLTEGSKSVEAIFQGERELKNTNPGETALGCGICIVEVEGEEYLVEACRTEVKDGMVVVTENERITSRRQEKLIHILTRHRHACLTCDQQEGCSRSQCSSNVPENERCCPLFGHCELQDIVNYVGISPKTPKWIPTEFPVVENDPLFVRDYNLCIGCTRCVRACCDLRGVGAIGFVYDHKRNIQIGTLAPTLEDSGCKFCTACVEVCPTGALMDKDLRPGRKEEDLMPCIHACPAHIDIPAFLRLIKEGKRDEANAVIREKVPFPGVLGRTCSRPCEEVCRRAELNDAIAICALKRYAADGDGDLWKENSYLENDSGKSVAVVGAGPAGLTTAFYLKKKGHRVTVFETHSSAGGMMRYGIPDYRLPSKVLDREIQEILDIGVEFRPNQKLGRDFNLEELEKNGDGFDAIFLGVGAQLSRKIPLEGSDSEDVFWGVDFLERIAQGEGIKLKDRVVVIGGGNVAVDVARCALRCGAKEVTMACLEKREEMPAYEWEIEGALEEGVELMNSWGVVRILKDEVGTVYGMELVKCTSICDDRGNFSPAFDKNIIERLKIDQVIVSIGQATDLSFLENNSEVFTKEGLIAVNEETLETDMQGVYAGGDVTDISRGIIHAIAAGRKAASSIDKYLGGDGKIEEVLFPRGDPKPYLGKDEGFASWRREKSPQIKVAAKDKGFDELVLGFQEEKAKKEAGRCLQCDLRGYLSENTPSPKRLLYFEEENVMEVPEAEGVYQLLDEKHNVLIIKGCRNLREGLLMELEENDAAVWFEFEEEKMYSQRENELIQNYLQEHGEMPGRGDSDLDDLF